ncbi:HPP family protein [Actinophytocola glycyrrhizae]|uniref:HPP family protein n=1 Tax=Actinophytocola glycyrrhizae TaxID=2044873 RepID=A0ABV9RU66_9PSEU
MTVASVMTRCVVTVEPQMPVRELVVAMAESGLSALPVVDGRGMPLGVVSEADLVLGRARWLPAHGRTAAEVIGASVRAVHVEEPVSFVARVLAGTGMRRLFVTDWDGRLVGVVSRQDLRRSCR